MITEQHIRRQLRQQMLNLVGLFCILILCGCTASKSTCKGNMFDKGFDSARDPRPTARTLATMATILTSQGKFSESEALLRKAIQEHPEYVPAYDHLAELYMHVGNTELAILTLSAGLEQNPDNPRLLNNLGMCWLVRKDYEKALEAFVKSAGLAPNKAKYRSNMAVALAMLGRYEEARSLFEQVMTAKESEHNLRVLREAGHALN